MTGIRARIVAFSFLMAVLLVGPGAPAVGATPVAVDQPPVGRHVLIDDREFPGADCRTTIDALTSIRVRPPVMYARDRTSDIDQQKVGWRWQLRDSSFTLVQQGPIQKASATDRRPASFSGQTIDMTGRPAGPWFVAIRMFWYQPGSSSHVQGKALHYVREYALRGSFRLGFDAGCDSGGLAILQEPLPQHANSFGVHVLLDDVHVTPVRCVYGPGALGGLVSVRVRQPILFARDTGSGTQTQRVRWRFVVEATDVAVPDKNTVWEVLDPRPSFVIANATDHRAAGFSSGSQAIAIGDRGHAHYRVELVLNWLSGSGSVAGSAVHVAEHYAIVTADGSTAGVAGSCGPSPAV